MAYNTYQTKVFQDHYYQFKSETKNINILICWINNIISELSFLSYVAMSDLYLFQETLLNL